MVCGEDTDDVVDDKDSEKNHDTRVAVLLSGNLFTRF